MTSLLLQAYELNQCWFSVLARQTMPSRLRLKVTHLFLLYRHYRDFAYNGLHSFHYTNEFLVNVSDYFCFHIFN